MDTNYWLAQLIVFLFFFLLAIVGAIGTLTLLEDDTIAQREAIANCLAKGGTPIKLRWQAIDCAANS